ncbi:EI24 domain-containing protein [Variovorax terrae]|uniref:EI24 domain-containing protein n=1 Tax=Variovorax terrae TaxID=2923278 RepID=A0A9X2AMR6_9BURK|nr:EI24 domain-containing protein [Variovorax terrae]MCJ0764013.1 EI24 domain-containing protein [Variovorax terrae]
MSLLLDSFWRAVAYCLHPRVIALSFLPLVLMVALSLGLGYFYWDATLEWVRGALDSYSLLNNLWSWLQGIGAGNLKTVVAPLIVIFVVTPAIVLLSLLVVAVMMTPALVSMVAERRFPALERKKGGSLLVSIFWSLGSTLLAAIALVVSVPLWLVPPLILVLPPLIWGWLTYRVMTFDALADHASKEERREIFRSHRGWLLGIGILTGYLGAAPSIVWASGALFAAAFVILVPVAIWIYTLVFAFSSLWFAHYCLAALEELRRSRAAAAPEEAAPPLSLPAAQPAGDNPVPRIGADAPF